MIGGLEVLRRVASEGAPPVTVRLVDWADEEGARFGRSLFGSSAVAGRLNKAWVNSLVDSDDVRLPDAVRAYGMDVETTERAHKQIADAGAYLEMHIEQGPVLESMNLPLGAVLGTFGVERHAMQTTMMRIGQGMYGRTDGQTPPDGKGDEGVVEGEYRSV